MLLLLVAGKQLGPREDPPHPVRHLPQPPEPQEYQPGPQVSPYSLQKKDKGRREGKGRRCWLGDILECRTNHLAAAGEFEQQFWESIHFGRVGVLEYNKFCPPTNSNDL